jgi:peroxidase
VTRSSSLAFAVFWAALSVPLLGIEDCQAALLRIDPNEQLDPDAVEVIDGIATREFRSIDGTGNHRTHFTLGAAETPLLRVLDDAYADSMSAMAGGTRPSPREVSNLMCAQEDRIVNPLGASDFLWQWGQFLDHDIDLTETQEPAEPAYIFPEPGDLFFDPLHTGEAEIVFHRSIYHPASGTSEEFPRQQLNLITHYIDASNVYGSDPVRAAALRTNDGTGRLAVSPGDLLPFNTNGLPNAGGTGSELFLAGDVRANEQVGLTAMHTLFVREHNRRAVELAQALPGLSGDEIYERARAFVGGLMQRITYDEFLPALLGPDALRPYSGYKYLTSPAIMNCFSTAAYRFGHSAVSDTLLRLDANGQEIPFGHLPLKDAFFAPHRLLQEGGIEPILRGLATQEMSAIDTEVVDGLRNFLFGPPSAGGLDLASLNIQRGRDHGLPDYASAVFARGLGEITSFDQVSSNPLVQSMLAAQYGSVDRIDMWVGGIAEDPVNGGHLGRLFFDIIKTQFESLRDGDRYWYEQSLPTEEVIEIQNTTLADVIRRNTSIDTEIDDDVFHVN